MTVFQVIEIAIVVIFCVAGYFLWDRRGVFKPTQEVFTDPTTGKLTRVYEDTSTGKRQYREEP